MPVEAFHHYPEVSEVFAGSEHAKREQVRAAGPSARLRRQEPALIPCGGENDSNVYKLPGR